MRFIKRQHIGLFFVPGLLLLIGAALLLLPSVSVDSLMNGTQSGKTIVFLYLMIGTGGILGLRLILSPAGRVIRISLVDLALSLWVVYLILNSFAKHVPVSLRFIEFHGLVLFYIASRQINLSYRTLLFMALMLGGGIQALYGNLQLWGFYASHHSLFKMSGSFFNPGPYAGYLACIFPAALGFYLFRIRPDFPACESSLIKDRLRVIQKTFLSSLIQKVSSLFWGGKQTEEPEQNKQERTGVITIPALILIVLVLPASRSRAAWLAVIISAVVLLLFKYPVSNWFRKHLNTSLKRIIVLLLAVVFTGVALSGLYYFKKGSADGRTLVWKVTLNMIGDYPVPGVGFDQFKAHYMDYQAGYFEKDPEREEAMVAGDSNYAFNELIQQTAENGIIGPVMILSVLASIFISSSHRPDNRRGLDQSPDIHDPDHRLLGIAKAGVVSIIVFSFFSYPAQILPIKTSLVFYLAVVAGLAPQKTIRIPKLSDKRTGQSIAFISKITLTLILLAGIAAGYRFSKRYTLAYRDWQSAFQVYQMGAYEACLEDYEKAYPVLHDDGDFLTNYGKALSMAGEDSKAIAILQQATGRYPNTVVYTALGDSYKALGETDKAEQAYLHAWYMNPSRFYPKYLLAKLYNESGQKEKAVTTAKELLEKQVKIGSTAIEEIRAEMEKIISENKTDLSHH
ncbi:MAG: O-antigen ligase family protein [Mangrovibacterium sp.]|nr:O-antigen ligase family protein [Mangrovibacterium sp.]